MKCFIKDLGRVSTGNTPSKKEEAFYDSDDIGFVKPDIISDSEITYIEDTQEYLSESARKKARIVPINSVFVTCIGSIGKVGIAKNKEFAFNQQINAIEPNEKVLPEYLAYCLFYNKKQLADTANAPVVPIINKTQFELFEISIDEDIKKQAVIIDTLNHVNEIMHKKRQQLEQLDFLIKARFVELFGTYPNNEKGWECGTIRDLVSDVRYGSSRKAADGKSGKYPYLRMNNISYDGELDLSDTKTINVPEDELDKCTVKKGDVLFNRTNSKELVGKTCVYNRDEMMVLAGFVVRVRVNGRIVPEFLSGFLNTDFSKQMLYGMCKAAIGQANINAQELQNIRIYIPPIDVQKQFVKFKAQVDKSKAAVQKSIEETQVIYDSLMQQYFG